jgi:hypothetical protein
MHLNLNLKSKFNKNKINEYHQDMELDLIDKFVFYNVHVQDHIYDFLDNNEYDHLKFYF